MRCERKKRCVTKEASRVRGRKEEGMEGYGREGKRVKGQAGSRDSERGEREGSEDRGRKERRKGERGNTDGERKK